MYKLNHATWIFSDIKWEKTLKQLTKSILDILRKCVYDWELDKSIYRNVYRSTTTNKLKTINAILEYETWYKIVKE